MREILFKAKRFGTDNWIEGYLIKDWDLAYIYWSGTKTQVNLETVGQFTGLTDKNGKKIFEGDILKLKAFKIDIGVFHSVFLCEDIFTFKCINTEYHGGIKFIEEGYSKSINMYEKTVIGNIHDNPELLN